MKNSFMWFLGFVGVLLVGMFFAIPNNQSIQNNEIATQLEGQEKEAIDDLEPIQIKLERKSIKRRRAKSQRGPQEEDSGHF